MSITRFRSESLPEAVTTDAIENRQTLSSELLTTHLLPIALKLCLNNQLSPFEHSVLHSLFTGPDHLLIAKDGNCIFPEFSQQDEYSLCLLLKDEELNVCDLHNKYPLVVEQIEQAWPALQSASSRIKEIFENNDATLLINRASGRILAVSNGFTAITGLSEDALVGMEYGKISMAFDHYFSGKKIHLQNLNINDLFLSLVSISALVRQRLPKISSSSNFSPPVNSYRLVDESRTASLYAHRFNTLLESNFHDALPSATVAKLEQIISEMKKYCHEHQRLIQGRIDSAKVSAYLRLLIQSALMAHMSLAGQSSDTDFLIYRDEDDNLQIRLATPLAKNTRLDPAKNEWWQLAESLAEEIGLSLTELQLTEQALVNRIQIISNIQPTNYAH